MLLIIDLARLVLPFPLLRRQLLRIVLLLVLLHLDGVIRLLLLQPEGRLVGHLLLCVVDHAAVWVTLR